MEDVSILLANVTSLAMNPPAELSSHPHMAVTSMAGVINCGMGSDVHSRRFLSQDLPNTFNKRLHVILVVYGGSKLGAK
jgi:hypothetical protein